MIRKGAERGPRDEIDIIAVYGHICVLLECKDSVAHAKSARNRAGENDFEKLSRLASSLSIGKLQEHLAHCHGAYALVSASEIVAAVVVGIVDSEMDSINGVRVVSADALDTVFA